MTVKKSTKPTRDFSLAPEAPRSSKRTVKKVKTAVVDVETPRSRHVVTRKKGAPVAREADPFKSLCILDLKPEPMEADVTVIIRYTYRNVPIEHVFTAHWVMIKEDERGSAIEADVVIDIRDVSAELPPDIAFADNETMRVEIWLSDSDETSFEAIRGMFRTEFGVFHIFKFLSAYGE